MKIYLLTILCYFYSSPHFLNAQTSFQHGLKSTEKDYPQMKFAHVRQQADSLRKYVNLHDAWSERQFFCAFPGSFKEMNKLFGFDDKKGPAPLYTDWIGDTILIHFSKLQTIPRAVFYRKYFQICVNGIWEADHMREAFGLAVAIEKEPEVACRVIAMAPDKEIISVFRFMFDGPHPDNPYVEQSYQEMVKLLNKHNQRLSKLLKIAYAELLKEMDCHGH